MKRVAILFMVLLATTFALGQDLFISEYMEGSGYNKTLEIYNPTDAAVSLNDYAFPNSSNGSDGNWEYWNTFTADAVIEPGETYVIVHPDAAAEIVEMADQTFTYFGNGDDAFGLAKVNGTDTTIIDIVGDFGADPGDGWSVAGVANGTKDHTLVRKASVTGGNADFSVSAGTNADDSEWIVLDTDVADGLGIHNLETVALVFSVDMSVYSQAGDFDASTMVPDLMGSFDGWSNGLVLDNVDLIYFGVIDTFDVGTAVSYKFRGNSSWDDIHDSDIGDNRSATADYSKFLPTVYLNNVAPVQAAVTFQVDMSVAIKKNELDKTTLAVGTAGMHNGWTAGGTVLTDDDGDSVYVGTASFDYALGGRLEWKANYSADGTDWGWESVPNRSYTLDPDTMTLDIVYWDNDLGLGEVDVNLTFAADMSVKMAEGSFVAATDSVYARGSFNDWGQTLLLDADGDSVYTAVVAYTGAPGSSIYYKFFVDNSLDWEQDALIGGGNREYVLTEDADQDVPVAFFNNDDEVNILVDGVVIFQVDMTVLQSLGFYDRVRGDSLQVRGGFNGWGGNKELSNMIREAGTEVYQVQVPMTREVGEEIGYKFFINLADGVPHAGEDFYEYELPAASGGGDRVLVWEGGNVILPVMTFNDYVAEGVIPDGDSVTVRLRMDMTDAMAYEEAAFDPSTSKLYFRWQDAWGAELQGEAAGTVPVDDSLSYQYEYTGVDNIWALDLTLYGPAPHAVMYNCIYVNADGSDMSESGPGFGYGRYRTQWLKPDANGDIVSQALDVVVFSNAGVPHEVELEPIANGFIVSVDETASTPETFTLRQNYPNPFNPTTTIEYTIPEMADVNLVIYNSLGQMVNRINMPGQSAGTYNVVWNGTNDLGQQVSTGVYFYKLEAGKFSSVRKMVFMK